MALVALVTAAVFMFFAGGLAAWSIGEPFYPAIHVALWLATLFSWVKGVGRNLRHLVPAIFSLYAGGGPLLWYLGRDLGNTDRMLSQFSYGPLLPLLISPQSPTSAALWSLLPLLLLGLALNFAGHLWRS